MSNTEVETRQDEGDRIVSSTDRVYQAIVDLRDIGRVATRQVIAEMTGLSMTVVDDRLRHLVSVHKIRRPLGGVYEPEDDLTEERAVSGTILANGRVKVEIGDQFLNMSKREALHLSALIGGLALQFRGQS